MVDFSHDDDPHAVIVTRNNDVVGSVPQCICGQFWKFLSLPKASIRARVLGKRVTVVQIMALKSLHVLFLRPCQRNSIGKKKIYDAEKMVQSQIEKWKMNCRTILHHLGRIHHLYHKRCPLYSVHFIKLFLWEFIRKTAGTWSYCASQPDIHFRACPLLKRFTVH